MTYSDPFYAADIAAQLAAEFGGVWMQRRIDYRAYIVGQVAA